MNTVLILRLLLSMLGHMCTLCLFHIYLSKCGIFPCGPQKVTVPTVIIHCKTSIFF